LVFADADVSLPTVQPEDSRQILSEVDESLVNSGTFGPKRAARDAPPRSCAYILGHPGKRRDDLKPIR
jgi:hypothetical protein